MKRLLIAIFIVFTTSPMLALADAGGAGQGVIDNGEFAGCLVYNCHCTAPYPNNIIGIYQTGIDGMPPDITSVTTAEDCHDACLVTFNSASPDGTGITSTFTCKELASSITDSSGQQEIREAIFPKLNVVIPGLGYQIIPDGLFGTAKWSEAEIYTDANGIQHSNLLGTYVNAIYTYLLGAASLVAVTMLMIAGLQYATARGDSKQVDNAKKRINNAVVGIILLLLGYNIAFIVNPATTKFNSLSLESVKELALDKDVTGLEGSASIIGATGTWENLSSPYLDLVKKSKAQAGTCKITEGIASPTGKLPNQGPHHWGAGLASGDFTKVTNLDWAADWGSDILAPFSGTVSYAQQTDTKNKCGNRIYLKASTGEQITICHAKDFLNGEGEYAPGQVTQGQVIGHLGGRCCAGGGDVPEGWVTQCTASGTSCTDPKTGGDCQCQPISQSGNTTGPHVHISMTSGQSNILSCLK